jgi:hypothetical protein
LVKAVVLLYFKEHPNQATILLPWYLKPNFRESYTGTHYDRLSLRPFLGQDNVNLHWVSTSHKDACYAELNVMDENSVVVYTARIDGQEFTKGVTIAFAGYTN